MCNDLLSGELNGCYLEDKSLLEEENFVQLCATTPNYKLISTTTGSLKPASWTTIAVIAAISALNPGAGVAAVSALASAIISDAGSARHTHFKAKTGGPSFHCTAGVPSLTC